MTPKLESLTTEARHPGTMNIDALDAAGVLRMINEEDKTVADVVGGQIPAIAAAVDRIVAALQSGGRLFYVGAGTSGRIALLDAAECPPTFGTDPDLVQALIAGGAAAVMKAIEGAEDDVEQGRRDIVAAGVDPKDVVVGIAASGRTPYVLGGLKQAKELGAATVAVVCNENSPMEKAADIAVKLIVGPEVIMGSTRMKAGTAQKLTLNMISTATMIRLGKVYSNLMINMQPTNEKLLQRAVRIVTLATGLDADDARPLLEAAGGRIDAALVMHLAGVDAVAAVGALDRKGGNVRAATRDLMGATDQTDG